MNADSNAPIGIFDSGIGGLSIARGIEKLLPNEQLLYFADSQYAPYGDKPVGQIIDRVNHVADNLIVQGVKAIVVACNTATVNAIEQLRDRVDIPVIGVEPGIKPAAKLSHNKKIGILVTSATASNKRFLNLVKEHKGSSEVFIQPCPGLVQLIESGAKNNEQLNALLNRFIAPLVSKNIDTLVLGCTHYPLISEEIAMHTDNCIRILETAEPVARELKRRLAKKQLLRSIENRLHHNVISSLPSKQQQLIISSFWQSKLNFTLA